MAQTLFFAMLSGEKALNEIAIMIKAYLILKINQFVYCQNSKGDNVGLSLDLSYLKTSWVQQIPLQHSVLATHCKSESSASRSRIFMVF